MNPLYPTIALALTLAACGSTGTPASTGQVGTGGTATTSTGSAGGTTSTGGSTGTGGTAALPPTFATECGSNGGSWDLVEQPGASIQFGVADASATDDAVCQLVLPGDPALGTADHVGPSFATEIDSTDTFSFGTYRTRVQLASCAADEEAVNGIFVFFNDGLDHDGDGLVDNTEIDIEILCGQPNYILLSSWTNYTDDTAFRKWSRGVDTATGDYLESPSDHEFGLIPIGNDPAFKHPGFPEPFTYYEMGFDWEPTHIRFFIVLDGQEVTLWDFTNQALIPQHPAPFLFNVWHPADHWYEDGSPDYPANDAVMRIDWFRYWASSP
ncbi:cellulose-binding, family II [Minicystis rosea]|nr:cellulose-binding, family II [Minicystis rosea]